jgi:O-methyltransferase
MAEATELYLDLMKRALVGLLYNEDKSFRPINLSYPRRFHKRWALNFLSQYLARTGKQIAEPVRFDLEKRLQGIDWPPPVFGQTMIGMTRLNHLQSCIEDVLRSGTPGDLIETGVWRGGATIFMRAVLQAYGVKDRCVWVADSFQGLPTPDLDKYPTDGGDALQKYNDFLVASLEEVKDNFQRYNLLDDQVRFLKGWFKDTLPAAPIKQLALLRLDGDMYESTIDALIHLYPKVSPGGYVTIDDYHRKGCRQAVTDYRSAHGIDEEIKDIGGRGVYWQTAKATTVVA